MDFIVVRLGKDSVADIRRLNESSPEAFEPYLLEFTCKQVESSIHPGAYVLLYLGSDNNKGTKTDWKQGLRALGVLKDIRGWENFQSECTLKIRVFSVFNESLDQFSFLDKSPRLYKHFSKYPVIGVRSSRNNSVQRVNEGPRESTSALMASIGGIYSGLKNDLEKHAPELISMLDFDDKSDPGEPSDSSNGDDDTAQTHESRGINIIFYGAPGTGKSHAIDKTIDSGRSIKTVFHAESMNSDFVGSIKPVMHRDDKTSNLSYEYIPGPFTKALIASINDPEHHYWLVIEEINRAPAAAVFGEIFQLLDRRGDGRSRYEIDFPDPLFEKFLNEHLNKPIDKIFIPSNLSILASMNSSDQGVMPLDTAFKRRWKFTYLPLDFDKGCSEGDLRVVLRSGEAKFISWLALGVAINEILADAGIPEDRHLGPYFLSQDDLADYDSVLIGKLFMYLWDDVLRHGLRYRLFGSDIKTYGQLVAKWENGEQVFDDDFLEKISEQVSDKSLS